MKTARQATRHQKTQDPLEFPQPLSRAQRREFERRREKLAVFDAAIATGLTKSTAARLAGVAFVTCWRWRRIRTRFGEAGLVPSYPLAGRRRELARYSLSSAAIAQLQRLCIATGGAARACRAFAEAPACPPALAELIHSSETPPSWLLATARPRRQRAIVYRGEGFEFVVTLD